MSTEVRNNTALERFEIYVDGAIAGYAEYQDTNAERAFVHTEIYSQYEGQGYGRVLVETALNQTPPPPPGAGGGGGQCGRQWGGRPLAGPPGRRRAGGESTPLSSTAAPAGIQGVTSGGSAPVSRRPNLP
ncbi:GNAT family N-acetyltransferase, partial [Nocardia cyriacigeorgica]|uniref:GNAT family N-acetyltransferase n=1 Tax=Nocardia cyriacigeorgica TaxID=135487 RepID=UPI002456DE56